MVTLTPYLHYSVSSYNLSLKVIGRLKIFLQRNFSNLNYIFGLKKHDHRKNGIIGKAAGEDVETHTSSGRLLHGTRSSSN